uniref:Uncharacterized protein n=1 Tax=Arundo donax TaxID=35708 RepID=A0A0A9HTX4_ARUDO
MDTGQDHKKKLAASHRRRIRTSARPSERGG